MTDEERAKIVAAEVAAHFAPKVTTPKQQIDPKVAKHFATCHAAPMPMQSNYERTISKAIVKSKRAQAAKQTTKKKKTAEEERIEQFMKEAGLDTAAEALGMADLPMAEVRWTYQLGRELVHPEKIKDLPTNMRLFHEWYMAESAQGRTMFALILKDEYFHRGEEDIWLEFEDLYNFYHQDAVNVSLMSCWCL